MERLKIGCLKLDEIAEKGIPVGDYTNVCVVGYPHTPGKSHFILNLYLNNRIKANEARTKKK